MEDGIACSDLLTKLREVRSILVRSINKYEPEKTKLIQASLTEVNRFIIDLEQHGSKVLRPCVAKLKEVKWRHLIPK